MTSRVEVPPLTGLIHFFSSRLRVKKQPHKKQILGKKKWNTILGHLAYFFSIFRLTSLYPIYQIKANSVDPDQMPQNVASVLG